uniref:Uncharacterized protein n=1 Tax=Anguilla anguilla TaxID=7936 RepID=A0A0E9QQ82_ANGAN
MHASKLLKLANFASLEGFKSLYHF